MPELPEVETVCRGLAPVMVGEGFASVRLNRPDLRFPFPERFIDRLEGAKVRALRRRAKFLVADLSTDETLTMHLGMTGRFTIHLPGEGAANAPGVFHHEAGQGGTVHDHVVFDMTNGSRIVFSDPRRFGFMEMFGKGEIETAPRFAGLGPEPLGNGFHAAYLDQALAGKATPIKAALLDQRVVAGLGNIYVCEALFRARISPRRLAKTIPGARADRLVGHVRDVLREAIDAGGSTLRDYAHTDGSLGYFQHRFDVYDQEGAPCSACDAPIRRIVQSGRSSFYCGQCQR